MVVPHAEQAQEGQHSLTGQSAVNFRLSFL